MKKLNFKELESKILKEQITFESKIIVLEKDNIIDVLQFYDRNWNSITEHTRDDDIGDFIWIMSYDNKEFYVIDKEF